MVNKLFLLSVCVCMTVSSGCTVFGGPNRLATIVPTKAQTLPDGAQPALVWTIDGERVPSFRNTYRVEPGRHTISVLPLQEGPISTTYAFAASAEERGIDILDMDVDLEAGQVLQVAAVVRRHRVYATTNGVREPLGPWENTVVPYFVGLD